MTERIQISAGESRHLVLFNPHDASIDIVIERDARLIVHIVSTDGVDSDNEIHVSFTGKGSEAEFYGFALTRGTQQLRIATHVDHEVGECKSRQLFKYLVAERSKASFYGLLRVAPDAQHTDAAQTNRNILLSSDAKMHTEPQLEIYADDVKCSHGATTGQLDESALFYMQQRCLSAQTARAMLLEAFVEDVIEGLDEQQYRKVKQSIHQAL